MTDVIEGQTRILPLTNCTALLNNETYTVTIKAKTIYGSVNTKTIAFYWDRETYYNIDRAPDATVTNVSFMNWVLSVNNYGDEAYNGLMVIVRGVTENGYENSYEGELQNGYVNFWGGNEPGWEYTSKYYITLGYYNGTDFRWGDEYQISFGF